MAIKRQGKAPAKKPAAKAASDVVGEAVASAIAPLETAKLTVSVKRRLSNGDEVFIAPGIEKQVAAGDLEEAQAEVTERVNSWLTELLEQYPDVDPMDEEDEDDEDETEEDETEEDEGEDEGEDEDELTEAEVRKMKKSELVALAEEYEIELESTKVADIKDELIAALFEDEDEEDEDEEDEDETDEGDEEDEDEDEEEGYDEEDLKAMKLDELQEICDAWEIDHPSIKKGTKLAAKKTAYIAHILEAQDEE